MRAILASVALIGLAGCSKPGAASTAIPPDALVAVSEGQESIPYGQVVSGDTAFEVAGPPVPLEIVPTGCRKPKARSGAKAAYVYTYGGSVRTPLHHVSFRDTPEQAAARRQAIQDSRQGEQRGAVARELAAFTVGNAVEWASRIDVLVTETEAPVFLYLSSYDPILWNIQLAPGARLDGVVVNSYDASAIANGMGAGRTAIVSFDNWPGARCYAKPPVRALSVAARTAVARKLNPDFNPRPHVRQWEKEYKGGQNFSAEVWQLLGKRPDWIITHSPDGKGINAILVGPPPAAPFPMQPISRLQVPAHITTFWGERMDAFKAFGVDAAL